MKKLEPSIACTALTILMTLPAEATVNNECDEWIQSLRQRCEGNVYKTPEEECRNLMIFVAKFNDLKRMPSLEEFYQLSYQGCQRGLDYRDEE